MALQADIAGNIDIVGAGPRASPLPVVLTGISKVTLAAARLVALITVMSGIVALSALAAVGGAYYLLFSLAH